MTLIIGHLCVDGVVMGADSAATFGNSFGLKTVRQPVDKLDLLEGELIVGVSGPVGLGQKFRESITDVWKPSRLGEKKPAACTRGLSEAMRPHALREMTAAREAAEALGTSSFLQSAVCSTLIAAPIMTIPCLIEFDEKCSTTLATRDLPFFGVGSGMHNAQVFLPFLRKMLFGTQPLKLADAKLLVYWALKYAIEIDPGGVAGPTTLAELRAGPAAGQWLARSLDNHETQELAQNVDELEGKLKAAASTPDEPAPPPPAAPAA